MMKEKQCKINHIKSQKGVTLLALVTVVMVLMIIAAVSISTLVSDHGAVKEATNAAIQAEISKLREVTDVYIRDKETARIKDRDYSSPTTKEDLASVTTNITTSEGYDLGVFKGFTELEFVSDYGKSGKDITEGWNNKMKYLDDCFAIDYSNNQIYYIDDGTIWTNTGIVEK